MAHGTMLRWSGSALLKNIGTYGSQASRLAFVDSAVKCDMGRYGGQGGEDSEPDSRRLHIEIRHQNLNKGPSISCLIAIAFTLETTSSTLLTSVG